MGRPRRSANVVPRAATPQVASTPASSRGRGGRGGQSGRADVSAGPSHRRNDP